MIVKVVLPIGLDRQFDYSVPKELETSVKKGLRVSVPFGHRKLSGFIVDVLEKSKKKRGITIKSIDDVIDKEPFFKTELFPLAEFITAKWGTPLGLVLSTLVPNYIETLNEVNEESKEDIVKSESFNSKVITKDQSNAVSEIISQIKLKKNKPFLIFHDSFTGVNEVYVEILKEVLLSAKQGLLLAPDVFSAYNFSEKLKTVFPSEKIILWRGTLTQKQKNLIYNRLSRGESLLVIGARSACLLPFKNLAAAIVDDEHNINYKQEENKPYYNAKDILFHRSKHFGFPVVLSSSVPSLESIDKAVKGKTEILRLRNKAVKCEKPKIITVSKTGAKSSVISDELLEKLEGAFERKKNALVILNRKGIENQYSCYNCKWNPKCEKCSKYLIKEKDELFCPKCKKREALPKECPKCRNRIFRVVSYGIKRAVSELKEFFPNVETVTIIPDTLNTKTKREKISHIMDKNKPVLILTTASLLGGYEFKDLETVAFLDFDSERINPDFRIAEKNAQSLFKTLSYLCGDNASVVIQTDSQGNPIFLDLDKENYLDFALREIDIRRKLDYPPHSRLIRIILEAKEVKEIEKISKKIIKLLDAYEGENDSKCAILGPSAAKLPFFKKNRMLRYHLIVKYRFDNFLPFFWDVTDKCALSKTVRIKTVVDPIQFY